MENMLHFAVTKIPVLSTHIVLHVLEVEGMDTKQEWTQYLGLCQQWFHEKNFLGENKLICWSTGPTDPILSKTKKNNITKF